jgi:transcriptional regulator with XRE-family HTH domain
MRYDTCNLFGFDSIPTKAQNTAVPTIEAPEAVYSLVGERLARLRGERGVSQDELGTFAGLTRASVANIEKGRQRVHIHQLYLFADYLHISLGDLLPDPTKVKNAGIMPHAEAAYLKKLRKQFISAR